MPGMATYFDEAIARIAEQHHGVFAAQHLDGLGVTRGIRQRRVETGRWRAVHDSVYRIAGAPLTWEGSVLAACWAGGTRALASHRSAAALWELPSGKTDVVELTCPRWRRARHDSLLVHETTVLDQSDRALVTNIPCTSPTRTLFDLARTSSPVMLDANLDSALRRQIVSLDALRETVRRLATQGRPGGKRFKTLDEARVGGGPTAESVPERRLADMLVRQGLPSPVLQYEIRDRDGRFVARVDLAYPTLMLAIEYDSLEHHVGKLALVRDSARRNALTELGFTVLTATVADIRDRGERLAASVRRIRERAA
jgi:very-short-patch-repair endonuclease